MMCWAAVDVWAPALEILQRLHVQISRLGGEAVLVVLLRRPMRSAYFDNPQANFAVHKRSTMVLGRGQMRPPPFNSYRMCFMYRPLWRDSNYPQTLSLIIELTSLLLNELFAWLFFLRKVIRQSSIFGVRGVHERGNSALSMRCCYTIFRFIEHHFNGMIRILGY